MRAWHTFAVVPLFLLATAAMTGCGGDDTPTPSCAEPLPDDGDPDGHAEPFGASATEARAGRITRADQLPATTLGLETWNVGDYVLANDRVAIVIEDVGASQLYDPWGGRPVGIALVDNGAMVQPADFGELFLMIGRTTVVTEAVTVVNDGSNGQPAVVRARGRLAPLPFLDFLLSGFLSDDFRDLEAAIDYSLAPGAEVVDITYHIRSARPGDTPSGTQIHGLMYTKRMTPAVPGLGFTEDIAGANWAQLIDDDGASWAYAAANGLLGGSLAQSGFVGAINETWTIPRCAVTTRPHARIAIGGPGLDGLAQTLARIDGQTMRAITGTVTGIPAGTTARVHATVPGTPRDTYLTRAPVDATGAFTLHVPVGAAVTLTAVVPAAGPVGTTDVAADATSATIALPPLAAVQIDRVVDDAGAAIPARVQILPDLTGPALVEVPDYFGEPAPPGGRFTVRFHDGSPMRIPLVPGAYHVVVSRGPEYELYERDIDADAGQAFPLAPVLDRVVDTTGTMCGDFHIHTIRSNDAEDDAVYKLQSAMADGVEILVRSDHEWVDDFQPLIESRGWEAWAMGIGSIEMTSFEIWGHFGVFPLDPDPGQVNNGAPRWQTFPSATDPDRAVVTLGPLEVFDQVRARPERPAIIVNHPMGNGNYFGYVGLDPATGLVDAPEHWDEDFTLVETFNDSDFNRNRNGTVAAWFGLLNVGRPVFAVGSSDSHSVRGSPVGYPRTCIDLGTDDPRQATPDLVRDRLAAGHATVSGGIYVDAAVGTARPGDTATGGATADVEIEIEAASWVDVDTVEVIVDGESVATIPVTAADADPLNPAVRWRDMVTVDVAAGGSWVVVVAHGDDDLAPVHPGKGTFGVTNPIFLAR